MTTRFNNPVLSMSYFPPVDFFFVAANSSDILIEQQETYQKQSYRTRCHIYASAGLEVLQIPVYSNGDNKIPIREVKIDYSKKWIHQHEFAIMSAYKSSPFFDYYWDEIKTLLDAKEPFLFDLDLKIIYKMIELLNLKCSISLTGDFKMEYEEQDFRKRISPKYRGISLLEENNMKKPYYQVFSQKYGFIPNLSILDLLFHEGPESAGFLISG